MSKGDQTRRQILDLAVLDATRVGLEGLSIGLLADRLSMSKSGLFAHFGSKEALQIAVLDHASASFVDEVVRPGLRTPRGEARMRALFDGWLGWGVDSPTRGGCLFVAASSELDDQPGPVRDRLADIQRDWLELLASVARAASLDGKFRPDLDADGFAQEMMGILLGAHLVSRLITDKDGVPRARAAFERLLADARAR